ncbi:hypothetical protein B0H11DRAFT_1944503 [Mycena galericulata]|nr:hypothetical protein B0H11DRAFT_1944503 [Mycena galericulata]
MARAFKFTGMAGIINSNPNTASHQFSGNARRAIKSTVIARPHQFQPEYGQASISRQWPGPINFDPNTDSHQIHGNGRAHQSQPEYSQPSFMAQQEITKLFTYLLNLGRQSGSFKEVIASRRHISQVSKIWRHIVRSTCTFWTRIVLPSAMSSETLEDWLSNTAFRFITMDISLIQTPPAVANHLLSILLPSVSRCTTFSASILVPDVFAILAASFGTQSLPHLRELAIVDHLRGLSIGPRQPIPLHAPALQTLHLQNAGLLWATSCTYLRLHTLVITNCRLSSWPTWSDLQILCTQAPNLERVALRFVGCTEQPLAVDA